MTRIPIQLPTSTHYIEAITGSNFEVKVTFDSQFLLRPRYKNSGVSVHVRFDNCLTEGDYYYFDDIRDAIEYDGAVSYSLSDITIFDPASQQHLEGSAKFAALKSRKYNPTNDNGGSEGR